MREIDLPKTGAASAVSASQLRNRPVREWLFKLRALIALVLLIVVFSALSPAFFGRLPAGATPDHGEKGEVDLLEKFRGM